MGTREEGRYQGCHCLGGKHTSFPQERKTTLLTPLSLLAFAEQASGVGRGTTGVKIPHQKDPGRHLQA